MKAHPVNEINGLLENSISIALLDSFVKRGGSDFRHCGILERNEAIVEGRDTHVLSFLPSTEYFPVAHVMAILIHISSFLLHLEVDQVVFICVYIPD